MGKTTLKILEKAAWDIQRHNMRFDSDLRRLVEEEEELYCAFREKHRHNNPLIRQVNDLIDANYALGDACSEMQFYIGLQMGLELAALDVLETD